MIKSIISDYGFGWVSNRMLYSAKLKMMSVLPITEKLFEKNVQVKRLDIFKIQINEIEKFIIDLPDDKKSEISHMADKAIHGIVTGFSSIELDYGYPINWHYNPLTRHEVRKNVKWYKIKDFDPIRGDIKAIWEASRFTHFLLFARAYLLTGDIKYYKAFSGQLSEWLKDNPYSYGVNYKCGQECSLRMVNALMAYTVFAEHTTADDEINMNQLINVCYKKVLSNFFYAHKCIKNNHTLSEICGIMIGAWCCDDYRRLHKAYRLMNQEIMKQFMLDGGYVQYSFNYQRFALQIMECIYKISESTGLSISKQSKELIRNSVYLMYQCQDQTGDMPNYGLNDGSLIFPVTACGYRDFTPVINTLYALITGNRLYENGFYDEELLWFGKGSSYPMVNVEKSSNAFINSGIYTFHNPDGYIVTYLSDYHTRPAHMDGLHVDLWHKGRNVLCDTGTFSYADDVGKELSKSGSHNTVKLSTAEQMSSYNNFMVYKWYRSKGINYNTKNFKGTLVSKNGYEHTREIQVIEDGYRINDEVMGNNAFCEFHFHTPYEARLIPSGFEVYDHDEFLCSVHTQSGDFQLRKAYRSLYYLNKEEICQLVLPCKLNSKCKVEFMIELEN